MTRDEERGRVLRDETIEGMKAVVKGVVRSRPAADRKRRLPARGDMMAGSGGVTLILSPLCVGAEATGLFKAQE